MGIADTPPVIIPRPEDRPGLFSLFAGTVHVTWFNSEPDPPRDLELSTTPEARADNLLCIPP
jgi:hypothetical protein